MATIVAAMAMTHSPGLTGWFDAAPKGQQEEALRATAEMRERLAAARPDVVIAFSNDHLLNWPINNTPEYTVGIAAEHVGPADWYDEWLALSKYRIPGHPALARYIVNDGARRRLALAYLREMKFDDGISVPMHYLNPDGAIPLIPVTMNCTVPPIPTPERAYQVGSVLRDMLRGYPGRERIALLATGGLSHEPGGPRYFWVDEEFEGGFSICSSAAITRRCCASVRSNGWRTPDRAAPPSCWRGSSCSRSPRARPTCSPTCPPSPGAPAPAWWRGSVR